MIKIRLNINHLYKTLGVLYMDASNWETQQAPSEMKG